MIRWLRKRDLREGINTHLQALNTTLLRLEVAERDHLKSHAESPVPVNCCALEALARTRVEINLRQRILRAELRDLTGGWPWVKVTDNSWHHLLASTDFEGMSFAVYAHLSTDTVAGAPLKGFN